MSRYTIQVKKDGNDKWENISRFETVKIASNFLVKLLATNSKIVYGRVVDNETEIVVMNYTPPDD